MQICLPKEQVERFVRSLKEGRIIPEKLGDMTSNERRTFFSEIVGLEDARSVNALFESKLLLKNQKQGLVTWAKTVAGLKEPVRRDMISRIEKMEKVLDSKEEAMFLEDLASQKLGTDVTYAEAKQIMEMSKDLTEAKIEAKKVVDKPGYDVKKESISDKKIRTEYGVKLVLMQEYVLDLKGGKTTLTQDIINAIKDPKKFPIFAANVTKSIVASLDNSFFLNQGIFALFDYKTSGMWFNVFKKSFGDIGIALKGGDPVIGIKGDIYSRPNALNGNYERMKLAIEIATEEAIPTTIGEKLPIVGRFFKASNSAYNGAALRLRADIADMKIKQWEKNGQNLKDREVAQSLGNSVNAFTGRGDTGVLTGENVNAFVFSVKFAKSKFDVLTSHLLSSKVDAFTKQQAALSLLRMTGASAATMALSETINPGSTELDPRGTNFGKIKIGNTWYPTALSGAGIPNLVARTLIQTTHNGKWGLWMKNNKGVYTNLLAGKYGQLTARDIAEGYFEGKGSPIVRALLDTWNGKDFQGNKSTPGNVAQNLITPITIGNVYYAFDNPKEEYPFFNALMAALGSSPSIPKK